MRWTIWYSFKHGQVKTVQKWKWPTGLSVFWSGPVGKDSQNDLVLDERILAFSKWQNIFWVSSDDLCGLCHEALVDLKKANKSSRGTIRFRISRNISSGWPKASFFILKIKKLTLHGQILHFEYIYTLRFENWCQDTSGRWEGVYNRRLLKWSVFQQDPSICFKLEWGHTKI